MANKLYDETAIVAIADAIRAKTGTTTAVYKVSDMANAIANIPSKDDTLLNSIVDRTVVSATLDTATKIGSYAFAYCTNLVNASFPKCTNVGPYAFRYCSSLTTVSFPTCTIISSYAFNGCTTMTTAYFPKCITVGSYAFSNCLSLSSAVFTNCSTIYVGAFGYCKSLKMIKLPYCKSIYNNAFYYCTSLSSVYLGGSTVPSLPNSSAFIGTPIASKSGKIYIPSSLYSKYLASTNWAYFSACFVSY